MAIRPLISSRLAQLNTACIEEYPHPPSCFYSSNVYTSPMEPKLEPSENHDINILHLPHGMLK